MSAWKRVVCLSVLAVAFEVFGVACMPQGGTVIPGGDAAAGQTTFNARCARCHTAASLRGHENLIVSNLAGINIAMAGITLSDQEIANLQAFIATQ